MLKKCSVTKAQPRLFGAAADPADNPNAAENRKSRVPRGLGEMLQREKRCTEARARVTLEVPDDEEGTWGFFPLPSRFFALHGLLRLPSQGGRLTLR